MANQQFSERMTCNLTPLQKRAAQEARKAAGYADDSEMFRALLAKLCAEKGIAWPEAEVPTEGPNWKRGKGGRFTEKP